MLYIQTFKINRTTIDGSRNGPDAVRRSHFIQASQELGVKINENLPCELTETTPDTETYDRRLLVTTEKNWIDLKKDIAHALTHPELTSIEKIDLIKTLVSEFEKK